MVGVLTQESFKLDIKLLWRDLLCEGVFVGAEQFIGKDLKHSKVLGLYNGGMIKPSAELVRREGVAVIGEVAAPGSHKIRTKAETVASLAPTVAEELPPFVGEKGRDLVATRAARGR